jgi:hypothetical protein
MSETRKLAAILAADVVGYSRLMGEDEARPRTCNDPLLVELADDRPVLENRQPQIGMPNVRNAVRNIGGLLSVEENHIARQPKVTARPVHPDDRGGAGVILCRGHRSEIEFVERPRQR